LAPSWLPLLGVKGGGGNCGRLKRGGSYGGATVAASWRGGWGRKRGGTHGAVAREEGEAALGRRGEEEEGRVAAWAKRPISPAGHVGQEAEWAGWPLGRK
jgi:hypothetical protein